MSDPERRSFPAAKLRRGRNLGPLVLLSAVSFALSFVPGVWRVTGYSAPLMLVSFGLTLVEWLKYSPRGGRRVEVGPEGLHAGGRLALPRAWLERARVTQEGEQITVTIERRKGLSIVEVSSVEQGEALVDALALGAAQTLSTFRFDSPVTARIGKSLFNSKEAGNCRRTWPAAASARLPSRGRGASSGPSPGCSRARARRP